jgi:superfamily II DNA or RNA helicase
MTQNEAREIVNKKSIELSNTHKHLLLEHFVGTGKGYRVAQCIANSQSDKKWLVVVPEIVQIENYKQDLIKFNMDYLLGTKIHDIICYASLRNYENTTYNIHLNEAHRSSEERLRILKTIDFDQIISDSATIPLEVAERLNDLCPFYRYYIGLEEANELNLIPVPTIYVTGIDLDSTVKNIDYSFGKIKKQVSALEYYELLNKNIDYWKSQYFRTNQLWQKNKMLQASIERKRFLSLQKTDKVKQIIENLRKDNKRFVCFAGSKEQANKLGTINTISSDNNKATNLKIIEDFNNLLTNELYACAMGKEGLNLTNIDAGIIIQLDKENLANIQRMGRAMRSDNPEIYLPYVKKTKDYDYLKNFLEESQINSKNIKNLD